MLLCSSSLTDRGPTRCCCCVAPQMLRLVHLFASTTSWAGQPAHSAGALLEALRTHPTLKHFTALTDALIEGYISAADNTLLLRLARDCPALNVVAVERGTLHPHTRQELCCFAQPIDRLGGAAV